MKDPNKKDGRHKVPGAGKKKGQSINQFTDSDYNAVMGELVELITVKKYDKWSLIKHCAGKAMSSYQIDKAIKMANDFILNMYKDKSGYTIELALNNLNEQLASAQRDGDKRLTLEITKEINKITGLYINKVEHSGKIDLKPIFDGYETESDETV